MQQLKLNTTQYVHVTDQASTVMHDGGLGGGGHPSLSK